MVTARTQTFGRNKLLLVVESQRRLAGSHTESELFHKWNSPVFACVSTGVQGPQGLADIMLYIFLTKSKR